MDEELFFTLKQLFRKVKYDALKLIATKKLNFIKGKISKNISRAKKLWEFLKYVDMQRKTLVAYFSAMKDNDTLAYNTQ